MSLGINLLMYLTEIASQSLGNNFLSKVFEIHHRHKKRSPFRNSLNAWKGYCSRKKEKFLQTY